MGELTRGSASHEVYVEGTLRLDIDQQRQMAAYEHAGYTHDEAVRQIAQDALGHTGFGVEEASDR